MSPSRRKKIRCWTWTALIICLIWDGWMGEDAISPGACWLGHDMFGG